MWPKPNSSQESCIASFDIDVSVPSGYVNPELDSGRDIKILTGGMRLVNHGVVIPSDGMYCPAAQVRFKPSPSKDIELVIMVNSSPVRRFARSASSLYKSMSIPPMPIELKSGDVVGFFVKGDDGLHGTYEDWLQFSIVKVG
jgi:hypothetical protein